MAFKYHARNDVVIVRLVKAEELNGLIMPERSAEGNYWEIVAVGPDCGDLKAGQRVVGASPGSGLMFPVPGEKGMLAVDQKHVLALVEVGNGSA